MSTVLTDVLIQKVKVAGEAANKARREMVAASDSRAEAVFSLWVEGMTVRGIAKATAVSPSVSQRLLEKARAGRPVFERREERVSYELHRAVAEKLRVDPQTVRSKAKVNLARLATRSQGSFAEGWVSEWSALLAGPVENLIEVMLRPDERSIDLRQMTPFAGVLTDEERLLAIHKATRHGS
ncbi:hypothetical protein [Arthrobacter sp. KNU40]|uniref:hypothetical protein n=1 Tax=Arthrobacter sp. KNU40 TaxID=3447965 RepID=UPI003F6374FB